MNTLNFESAILATYSRQKDNHFALALKDQIQFSERTR